jgi:hypothetical protein
MHQLSTRMQPADWRRAGRAMFGALLLIATGVALAGCVVAPAYPGYAYNRGYHYQPHPDYYHHRYGPDYDAR